MQHFEDFKSETARVPASGRVEATAVGADNSLDSIAKKLYIVLHVSRTAMPFAKSTVAFSFWMVF